MGETEYRVNWVPLGGYVKMLGQEDLDPAAQSDDPRAFGRKPIWARACVISAGVIMNLIFGVLFFVIAFTHGVKFNPPVVGDVGYDSPAATVYAQGHNGDPAYKGLRPGDTVVSVGGDPVSDFGDLAVKFALSPKEQPISVVVERPADTDLRRWPHDGPDIRDDAGGRSGIEAVIARHHARQLGDGGG